MPDTARSPEALGRNLDPGTLFQKLKALKTEERKNRLSSIAPQDVINNYLRTEFAAVEDIDEFVAEIDGNDDIALTKPQIKELKADLAAFKEYLPSYLADFGNRAEKLVAKEKEAVDASKEYVEDQNVRAQLARERRIVAQAVFQAEQISLKPRHGGTTLKEGMVGLAVVKYQKFIDGLGLSEVDTKKLKEAMTKEKYESARATALELNPNCKISSHAELVDALISNDKAWFEYICLKQEAPRVVIVTDNDFKENISAMNDHRHYTGEDGKTQESAYVNSDSDSPYRDVPKQEGTIATLMDGVPHRSEAGLEGVSPALGARREHLVKYYNEKPEIGMRLADGNEMATLTQMTLKEAEAAGDNSLIVDYWKDGKGTVTILNPERLTESALVAYSAFGSNRRRVEFDARRPEGPDGDARGRGSVPFFKS